MSNTDIGLVFLVITAIIAVVAVYLIGVYKKLIALNDRLTRECIDKQEQLYNLFLIDEERYGHQFTNSNSRSYGKHAR